MPTPPTIDYKTLTPARLRDLRQRYEASGHDDLAQLCAVELERQGVAKKSDYAHLAWNQVTVKEALQPFEKLARFHKNRRTPYTEAGGGKLGLKKNEAEWLWVDSFAGMSFGEHNLIFVCQIKRPGDDPTFTLRDQGAEIAAYTPDQLPDALQRWTALSSEMRA